MSKWPAWVQAELDAGRISEEELDGWRVSLYGASWPDVGRPFIDIEPDALCLIGAGLVSAKRSESFREAFDYANNIIAALSGQPTAEVERLKQRVGELEEAAKALGAVIQNFQEIDDNGIVKVEFSREMADALFVIHNKTLSTVPNDPPERGEGGAGEGE